MEQKKGLKSQDDTLETLTGDQLLAKRAIEEQLMGGKQSGVFEQALAKVGGPTDVYASRMKSGNFTAPAVNKSLFPANICLEGHDQHSRWFLTSLVSSVALTGQAPFTNLKTHGMLMNEKGLKMSKSDVKNQSSLIDPMDLIVGTVKLDGKRSHGFGLDTMRLWAISKDGDKDSFMEREELEKVNQDIKLVRGLIRILLGNLHKYDASADKFDFEKLTFIDKVMACKLLKFVVQVTEAYEKFDLKKVYDLTSDFLTKELSDYYLPVSR